MTRIKRFDKRRFRGNKKLNDNQPRPSPQTPVSASKKKTSETKLDVSQTKKSNEKGHSIFNLELLQNILLESCVCKFCLKGKMTLLEEDTPRRGLAAKNKFLEL
jgi:hypothetical protein